MRTVFINQFFWPDEAATSQLLVDVVRVMAERRPVSVICGPAQYAGGAGSAPPDNVEIRRQRAGGFGHGKMRKLWSYGSFFLGAAADICWGPSPDMVVSMTTPPLLGILGWLAQRRGARHIIWEMDVYPDVAVELGMFSRRGVLDRVTGWLADMPRRRADGIIALGPCMQERLQRRGIGSTPVFIVHNWADGTAIPACPFTQDGRLKVFYSGNMGLAHDFETVVPAIRELGASDGFLFRFSGGGPRRAEVEGACASLPACEFAGYHAREGLAEAFAANDIGLVTQRADTSGTVVPSKVYGILAAGRGVLYVGPRQSTIGQLLEQHGVGWRIDNGDSAGLRDMLRYLQANRNLVEETGHRARKVFEQHFDRAGQVEKVLAVCGA